MILMLYWSDINDEEYLLFWSLIFVLLLFMHAIFWFLELETSSKKNSNQNQCLPQRAALLKSILNFLKKAIPDPAFFDNTRSLMDENLQNALKMIISNAEYYGALLFLLGRFRFDLGFKIMYKNLTFFKMQKSVLFVREMFHLIL